MPTLEERMIALELDRTISRREHAARTELTVASFLGVRREFDRLRTDIDTQIGDV